jgi:hypothetical protein
MVPTHPEPNVVGVAVEDQLKNPQMLGSINHVFMPLCRSDIVHIRIGKKGLGIP